MRAIALLSALVAALVLAVAARAEKLPVGSGEPVRIDFVFSPKALPKQKLAPVSISFSTTISTSDGAPPPPVRTITLRLDRNLAFDLKGYPSCKEDLKSGSVREVEALCRSAIVGAGRAEFETAASSPRPVVPIERSVLLNGGRSGKVRTLYFVSEEQTPDLALVVVPIRITAVAAGRYGSEATISIPKPSSELGPLTSLDLTINKKFIRDGRTRSIVAARCANGKLVLNTELHFADGSETSLLSARPCSNRPGD